MIGLRSLRNRVAVVFGLIVLGAIGTIYLTVTPRLEERLRNQKLNGLATDAKRYGDGFARSYARFAHGAPIGRNQLQTAATGSSSEVLILDVAPGSPTSVVGKMDSSPDGGVDQYDVSPLAVEAVRSRRP